MAYKYFEESSKVYEESILEFKLCFTKEDSESQSYKLVATSPSARLSKLNGEWNLQISMKNNKFEKNHSHLKFIVDLSLRNTVISDSDLFLIRTFISGYGRNIRYEDSLISQDPQDNNTYELEEQSFNLELGCRTITAKMSIIMYKRKVVKNLESVNLDDYWKSIMSYGVRIQEFTELSDFTFFVGNEEFKVHKLCMAAASEVMRAMLAKSFDESRMNSAVITDIDPKAFQIFVHYMYGNKKSFVANFTDDLVFEVFKVAHKYDVKNLENYCMTRIFKKFTSIDSILDTYEFACVYDIDGYLKNYCWEVIQYDLLKIFTPMKPVPFQKVLDYMKNVKELEEMNTIRSREFIGILTGN